MLCQPVQGGAGAGADWLTVWARDPGHSHWLEPGQITTNSWEYQVMWALPHNGLAFSFHPNFSFQPNPNGQLFEMWRLWVQQSTHYLILVLMLPVLTKAEWSGNEHICLIRHTEHQPSPSPVVEQSSAAWTSLSSSVVVVEWNVIC